MDLSIIIVNWNSRDYLKQSIASILENTSGIEFEIIVIDSASFDGCDQMLRQYYPQVRFIQSNSNLGFAKANNEAFKASLGRNLLFLNPDTEINGRAINVLLENLESMPAAGAAGARLLNSDGSVQTSCVRAFPTILNQVLDTEFLRKRFPLSEMWGMAPLQNRISEPTIVEAVSGACLMVKRKAFEEVGMFSPDYFMYSEDIDICYKLCNGGWKTYYVPAAVVIHHGSASSSQNSTSTFSDVMMLDSRWRFFRKTQPSWYSQLYRLAMFFVSISRIGFMLLMWPGLLILMRASLLEAALKKWTGRLRWTLGFEKWVKSF